MKAEQMSVSNVGVELVKHFEGCYLNAYQDVVGVWTIGYGHTKGVYRGQTINQYEADSLLAEDLNSHMHVPKQDLTIDMNQNQYDALCSFAFNLGAHIFRKNLNLLNAINNGDWNEAARIMNLFVNAGGKPYNGLIRRRKAETELLLKNQEKDQDVSRGTYDSSWFTLQRGIFTSNTKIKVRKEPSVNSEHLRTLYNNDEFEYDGFGYEERGYVWLRGVDGSYIASGETENGARKNYWGSFR